MKLKKGDTIKVLIGKDKGRTGKIQRVIVKQNQVVIDGMNIYKKHMKPKGEGKPGGIVELARPYSASKVAVVCNACGKITRVGYQLNKTGEKLRICRKCKAII